MYDELGGKKKKKEEKNGRIIIGLICNWVMMIQIQAQ